MKKVFTYVAEADFENQEQQFYICHAYNKEQMKYAGMNMKLEWARYGSRDEALRDIQGYCIKHETNVSSVRYW